MKLPTIPPIYLDYHATTPVDPRVAAVVAHAMTTAFGNANSTEHVYGEMAAALVTDGRREVAELVNANPEGVHFTSGSSESIRLAVAHAVAGRRQGPLRVALTTVEHRAVLDAVAFHARRGEIAVCWLPIDNQARLDMAALEAACHDGVDLVCVMAANNEVGTLYPVEAVARIAAQAGARTLIDTTQAAGRIPMQAVICSPKTGPRNMCESSHAREDHHASQPVFGGAESSPVAPGRAWRAAQRDAVP